MPPCGLSLFFPHSLHSFATPRLSVAVGQQLCIICGIAKNVNLRALIRALIREKDQRCHDKYKDDLAVKMLNPALALPARKGLMSSYTSPSSVTTVSWRNFLSDSR